MTENPNENKQMLSGTVEHIMFSNEENGYTVAEIICEDGEEATVSGIMPFLSCGEKIRVMGSWTVHPTYGPQFNVTYYEKELPATEKEIENYLASGSISGIGPKTAERIVARFGTDTFDVIEKHPEWLTDIKGITTEKAGKISKSFEENFGMRTLMMFFKNYMGPSSIMKVYKKWGSAAADLVKADPFSLCAVDGISFDTADKIASSMGMPKDFPGRIAAGIVNFLNDASMSGHTFLPIDLLTEGAARNLGVNVKTVEKEISKLTEAGRLVSVDFDGRCGIFLDVYYDAEKSVAERLEKINDICISVPRNDIYNFIKQLEIEFDITYADRQREAITAALTDGIMILTGGPGTGKTTVIRAIISVFEKIGMKVALAAPTGRAAKRLSEATIHEAKTIHRLLETDFTGDEFRSFRRDGNDTLDEDVIIVDEASMIDIQLADALLTAVKKGARLIFSGDADQLPSVGAGSFFRDMIKSGCFRTVELNEIFRQASKSLIVRNAHSINQGENPVLDCKTSDFFFIPCQSGEMTAGTVCDLYSRRLPKAYGEDIVKKIQVITPVHKGVCGTDYLNKVLQEKLNPPKKGKSEYTFRAVTFRVGDKVMQIKNNYEAEWERNGEKGTGVYNGDIGTVVSVSHIDENITVDFDGRMTVYEFSRLEELELAYAITVHKSQGCEFPTVIIPMFALYDKMKTRNLLYTAVTRAKEMVIIVGSEIDISGAVANNRQSVRYTALGLFLNEKAK